MYYIKVYCAQCSMPMYLAVTVSGADEAPSMYSPGEELTIELSNGMIDACEAKCGCQAVYPPEDMKTMRERIDDAINLLRDDIRRGPEP